MNETDKALLVRLCNGGWALQISKKMKMYSESETSCEDLGRCSGGRGTGRQLEVGLQGERGTSGRTTIGERAREHPRQGERGGSQEQSPACRAHALAARVTSRSGARVSRLSLPLPGISRCFHLSALRNSRCSPGDTSLERQASPHLQPLAPPSLTPAAVLRPHRHLQRSVQGHQRFSVSNPGALLSPSSFRVFCRILGKPPSKYSPPSFP